MPYFRLADGSIRKDSTKLHPRYREITDYTPISLPSEVHPDVMREAVSKTRKAQGGATKAPSIGDYKIALLLALATTQKHVYAGTAFSPRKAKKRAKQDRRDARLAKRRRDNAGPSEVLSD